MIEPDSLMGARCVRLFENALGADHDILKIEIDVRESSQQLFIELRGACFASPYIAVCGIS